jgi:aminopeptidase N
MRTEQARPVRLQDYQAPDWLVDSVDLDFVLHPTAARVRSRLTLRPNPAAAHPAPLVLDGDGLTLAAISVDGRPLPAGAYAATSLRFRSRRKARSGWRSKLSSIPPPIPS